MVVNGEQCDFVLGERLSFLEFLFAARGNDQNLISGIVGILSCQKSGKRVSLIDINSWIRFSPLHAAAAYGYTDVVKRLIDLGAELDVKTCDGSSVFHCAIGKYNNILFPKSHELGRTLSFGRVTKEKFQLVAATEWMVKRSISQYDLNEQITSPRTSNRMIILRIINRLEILKMIIDKSDTSIIGLCDLSGKLPQDYACDESLSDFLNGCTEKSFHNQMLYELLRSDLMNRLETSPKTKNFSMISHSSSENSLSNN